MFSDIVVIFFEEQVRWPPVGLADALREMYKIREFRVSYRLEIMKRIGALNLRGLIPGDLGGGVQGFLPGSLCFFLVL